MQLKTVRPRCRCLNRATAAALQAGHRVLLSHRRTAAAAALARHPQGRLRRPVSPCCLLHPLHQLHPQLGAGVASCCVSSIPRR